MEGYHCGGSLITSTHVLTAAHCTDKRHLPANWNLTKVRLGENDINTIEDCKSSNEGPPKCGIEILISKIINHELYSMKQGSPNDIAILKLKDKVQYTDYIMPICLSEKKIIQNKSGSGTIIGFGKTENVSYSDTLMKTEIQIRNFTECKSMYRARGVILKNSQMCAVGDESDSW
jgi:secreted trypsin-like serine protease